MKGLTLFDIESDNLLADATMIHCIATRHLDSRQERFFGPDEVDEGVRYLQSCEIICAHNAIGFDIPLIQRLYPWFQCPLYEDSLILSRLYNPDRGGHSIDEWGTRLGHPKPLHDEWSVYSDEMGHRCREDVRILSNVVRQLMFEAGDHPGWSDAIRIEYESQWLQNAIEVRGIQLSPLLQDAADDLASQLEAKAKLLQNALPLRVVPKGTVVSKPFTVSGTVAKRAANLVDEELISGPFSGVEFIPLNLGSPKQLNEFLYSIGWEPTEYNYKKAKRGGYELNPDGTYVISSPKVTEDSLESLDHPVAQHLLEYRVLKHRAGILQRVNKNGTLAGWVHERRSDGRIEAQAIPCGTPTHRYVHRQIVNMPKVGTPHSEYIRSMLVASDGMIMAGTDACGLEARVAGHYTHPYDGGEYAAEIMDGDIHTKNAAAFTEAAQFEIPRQQAKNIMYALLYGARTRKIATMCNTSMDRAEAMILAFWSANPGLSMLNDDILKEAKSKGYLIGIDGRKIIIRSPHAALNSYFQSCGAVLMKYAFNAVRNDNYWPMLLTMHDEWLCELNVRHLPAHLETIREVGLAITEEFKLNIPMEFDTNTGLTYAECH